MSTPDFFTKHEFLIRRLHSLSGLIPVGAYMTVHLLVNASVLNGAASFQKNVNQIHSLGSILPLVEWLFIFLPIIFHAAVGVWIIKTGKTNTDQYRYVANWRYSLQRWTGVIAILFIFFHVFHLHGWFHGERWLAMVEPLGFAQFRPYNAASTLAQALSGVVWPIVYVVGIVSCVFHLANGIWTMGITWGVWVSPKAQERATYVCGVFGALLLVVGLSALFGARSVDVEEARTIEDNIYNAAIEDSLMPANPHKRSGEHAEAESSEEAESAEDSAAAPQPASAADGQATNDAAAEEQKSAEMASH